MIGRTGPSPRQGGRPPPPRHARGRRARPRRRSRGPERDGSQPPTEVPGCFSSLTPCRPAGRQVGLRVATARHGNRTMRRTPSENSLPSRMRPPGHRPGHCAPSRARAGRVVRLKEGTQPPPPQSPFPRRAGSPGCRAGRSAEAAAHLDDGAPTAPCSASPSRTTSPSPDDREASRSATPNGGSSRSPKGRHGSETASSAQGTTALRAYCRSRNSTAVSTNCRWNWKMPPCPASG